MNYRALRVIDGIYKSGIVFSFKRLRHNLSYNLTLETATKVCVDRNEYQDVHMQKE